jgi:hypothetical protein
MPSASASVELRLLDAFDARGQERMPADPFDQPETLQAVAHRMDLAIGSLDLAHHAGQRTHSTQLVQTRFVDAGVLLQHDAQRLLGRGCLAHGSQ